jgi:hypothetical protein
LDDFQLALQLQADEEAQVSGNSAARGALSSGELAGRTSLEDDYRLALQIQARLDADREVGIPDGPMDVPASTGPEQPQPQRMDMNSTESGPSLSRGDFAQYSFTSFIRAERRLLQGSNLACDPLAIAIRQEFLERRRPNNAASRTSMNVSSCADRIVAQRLASSERVNESAARKTRRQQECRDWQFAESLVDMEEQRMILGRHNTVREMAALREDLASTLAAERARSVELSDQRQNWTNRSQTLRQAQQRVETMPWRRRMHQELDQAAAARHQVSHHLAEDARLDRILEDARRTQPTSLTHAARSILASSASAPLFSIAKVSQSCHITSDTCSICMESLASSVSSSEEEAYELPCKHQFHHFCIISWLAARPTCPLCRADVPRVER